MQTTAVENGRSTAFKIGHLTAKMSEGKILAEDLVEIGKRKAQRMVRRGYAAGEDYLDETTHYIKHHPWQSVGVALGVGAFGGVLLGWTRSRATRA
jgi:ElaB/YqjD/DUF883 family membrane-anchored ribosome-binding protein